MSHRIDQLFKERLGEHTIAPPDTAWQKVQASANQNKKVIIIWRIAAAVLLMGLLLSAWLFTTSQNEASTPQLTEKINKTESENVAPIEKTIAPAIEAQTEKIAKNIETQKPKKNNQKIVTEEVITPQKQEEEAMVDHVTELITNTEAETLITQVTEKPTVIEFTLPTLTETKEPIAVAAIEEEKSSGLKKIFETARDVKNGDAQFTANLRDMKNELLAFDFKKEKTKRN
jgi:hypothetical protein